MTGKQHQIVGIGWGIAGSILLYKTTRDPLAISAAISSSISCWWPDIDHNNSKLGRKRNTVVSTVETTVNIAVISVMLISGLAIGMSVLGMINLGYYTSHIVIALLACGIYLLLTNMIRNNNTYKWATKHRGIMHTLIPPLMLWFAQYLVNQSLWRFICIGFFVGYVSHLASDSITYDKVPALWPITKQGIGITLLRKKKKPENATKKEIQEIKEAYERKCYVAAYIMACCAIFLAICM